MACTGAGLILCEEFLKKNKSIGRLQYDIMKCIFSKLLVLTAV